MDLDQIFLYFYHLKRVEREIKKLQREFLDNPDEFGDFENRLYWAVLGVDPHNVICSKHHQPMKKNYYGEYACPDCIEELIDGNIGSFDNTIYLNPNETPAMRISGIRYGII